MDGLKSTDEKVRGILELIRKAEFNLAVPLLLSAAHYKVNFFLKKDLTI